jgi:hypothetical protein
VLSRQAWQSAALVASMLWRLLLIYVCSALLLLVIPSLIVSATGDVDEAQLFGGAYVENYSANGCLLWEVSALIV